MARISTLPAPGPEFGGFPRAALFRSDRRQQYRRGVPDTAFDFRSPSGTS